MCDAENLLMVTVSGKDRPGIAASFARVLLEHDVDVIDIEQASLQNLLGLSILVDLTHTTKAKDGVIKDLLFESSRLGLTLDFQLFAPNDIKVLKRRNLYVLTFFGGTRVLAELATILGEENANIEMMSTLDCDGMKAIEMTVNVNGAHGIARLKQRVMMKSRDLDIDLAIQKMEAYRKNKRLVFFDMDSTLIEIEVIDELARRAGVYREVARITQKAMRGDLDFEEALIQRVGMLKGLTVDVLSEIRETMKLSEGVETLAVTLKRLGFKLGIVTGGFDFFAEHLKEKLGFDFAFGNGLEFRNDALTGRVTGEIIDAAHKARIVNQISFSEGVLLDQTVVVGDGANDVLMLGQAGMGIAYNAKKNLNHVANASLGRSRLMSILYLLGITQEDIDEALAGCSGALRGEKLECESKMVGDRRRIPSQAQRAL